MTKGHNTEVKKRLENMTQSELVALVRELTRLNKINQAYLEAKFAEPSEIPKAAEYYKQIIKFF